MAVHTVPQDVETDDKILGPFSTRQFIYLIIVAALCGIGYLLAKIFIGLIIIVIPPIVFLLLLALPLKKDQPMETYLAAKLSFVLFKSRKRFWMPGQSETTILITAPKKVEENRTKGLDRSEVSRRLSFLADIVDTEGYAIKGTSPNLPFTDDVYAEAEGITDMYDADNSQNINNNLQSQNDQYKQNLSNQMRQAINESSNYSTQAPIVDTAPAMAPQANPAPTSFDTPQAPAQFQAPAPYQEPYQAPEPYFQPSYPQPAPTPQPQAAPAPTPAQSSVVVTPEMVELANNQNFTVETIAQQANRIAEKKKSGNDEVYISLR